MEQSSTFPENLKRFSSWNDHILKNVTNIFSRKSYRTVDMLLYSTFQWSACSEGKCSVWVENFGEREISA